MIGDILSQLGVDNTVFIQFIVICILFFISSKVLFEPLQRVLMLRAEKTTKTEELAVDLKSEYENLKYEYDEKIEQTYKETQDSKNSKKKDIEKEFDSKYKQLEQESNSKLASEKEKIATEYLAKKNTILSEADTLANQLVEKIHG